METLDRNTVVLAWLLRGIEDLFVAFSKFDESFSRYRQLLNAMGFEMACKSYLLAIKASEYEGQEEQQALARIDKLTKNFGHDLKRIISEISEPLGTNDVNQLLKKKFDGFTGEQFVDVITAAYFESRYFVPNPIYKNFPVREAEGLYWEPRYSSGLDKFCYAFSRLILHSLKSTYGITIPDSDFNHRVTGNAGRRFCNLFFDGKRDQFISSKS